jgi:hypothetical protein
MGRRRRLESEVSCVVYGSSSPSIENNPGQQRGERVRGRKRSEHIKVLLNCHLGFGLFLGLFFFSRSCPSSLCGDKVLLFASLCSAVGLA